MFILERGSCLSDFEMLVYPVRVYRIHSVCFICQTRTLASKTPFGSCSSFRFPNRRCDSLLLAFSAAKLVVVDFDPSTREIVTTGMYCLDHKLFTVHFLCISSVLGNSDFSHDPAVSSSRLCFRLRSRHFSRSRHSLGWLTLCCDSCGTG